MLIFSKILLQLWGTNFYTTGIIHEACFDIIVWSVIWLFLDAISYPPESSRYSIFSSTEIIEHMSYIVVSVSVLYFFPFYEHNLTVVFLVLFTPKWIICFVFLRHFSHSISNVKWRRQLGRRSIRLYTTNSIMRWEDCGREGWESDVYFWHHRKNR